MPWRTHIARFGRTAFPGERWARLTFLALLLLAAVLRFWDLPHLPYTHDELSALVRVYPSLGETIQRGVIELDTHPPGVQVFEWAWTKLFGMHEAAVKLPFILMALAALFLLYRFAQAWTSTTVALVMTALLATLQYTVLYAQIARPYAAGFFTTALLADQLTRYLAFGHRRALIGVGVAAVLSAYVHHFALLLAALMAATGFVLLRKEQRKPYLVMAAIAVLLYLPNGPIFLGQLAQGGLGGWLPEPDRHWLPDYAWWIVHGSAPLAIAVCALLLAALVRRIRTGGTPGPAKWLLLTWGLIPLAIGLAYSVWRAPVIQYSVVLFSFPYLLLALLMGLKELDRRVTVALCAALAMLSVSTLITDRRHYDLFYRSKYDAMIADGQALVAEQGPKAAVLIDAPDEVVRFLLKLRGITPEAFPYVQLRGQQPPVKLDSLLRSLPGRMISYGQSNGAPNENVGRVQTHFPVMLERIDLFEGQVFRFAAAGTRIDDREAVERATPMERSAGRWDIHTDLPVLGSGDTAVWDLTGREFGIGLSLAPDTLATDPQDQFEVVAEISGFDATTDASVVVKLTQGDSTAFYRTGDLRDLRPVEGRATLLVAVRRADARVEGPVQLAAYLHNPAKGVLRVHRFSVLLRKANRVQYGMFGPLK